MFELVIVANEREKIVLFSWGIRFNLTIMVRQVGSVPLVELYGFHYGWRWIIVD